MTRNTQALCLGLAAIFLWSTVATAFKLALREMDVLQLLLYAVSCSSVVLLGMVWRQGKLPLLQIYFRQRFFYFLMMGLLNPLIYYLVLLHAYDLLPAQQAQPINYTWAIMLALLAVPLLGQKLSRKDILAALMGYLGVVIIATQGRLLDMEFSSLEGVAFALVSTVIWAVYWIMNARNEQDSVVCLCLNFLVALPFTFILCVIFSNPILTSWQGFSAAIYVGLFEMGITFVLWSSALRLTSSVARIGNLIFLSPMISLIFIATILGEEIHPATLVGLALIIPGVLLQQAQGAASGAHE